MGAPGQEETFPPRFADCQDSLHFKFPEWALPAHNGHRSLYLI